MKTNVWNVLILLGDLSVPSIDGKAMDIPLCFNPFRFSNLKQFGKKKVSEFSTSMKAVG